MSGEISYAADQQRNVSEEINQNIVQINNVVRETTSGAEQTAEARQKHASIANNPKNQHGHIKMGT